MSDQIARFLAKVDQRGPDECWPWMGSKNSDGYGRVWWNGRQYSVGKVALIIARVKPPAGEPPTSHGWCGLHSCDNPPCANPAHLFWGSQPENNKDRMLKGRSGDHRGEAHGRAKISNTDVLTIRASSEGAGALATRYGLDRMSIWKIKTRRTWGHI